MAARCLQSCAIPQGRTSRRMWVSIRRMATLRMGDAAPQIIVLGLVIQQPDTIAGIGRRLADQFTTARFAKGSSHGNLPSLAGKGYVRMIEAGPPGEPTLDRYEATDQGREHFADWMRRSELPPQVRDLLQCKLELMDRDDVAALLRTVRELEEAFTLMCDVARARVLREQRARRARTRPVSWRVKLRGIQSKDDANLWSLMSQRLENLGDELEELLEEIAAEEDA